MNANLQEQLDNAPADGGSQDFEGDDGLTDSIPRPKGTAGNAWSIQEEMGLAGAIGSRTYDQYKSIQVCVCAPITGRH